VFGKGILTLENPIFAALDRRGSGQGDSLCKRENNKLKSMQLKGLVRFFTILLVLYSIYQLSFTWFVRGHENKLKDRAEEFVKAKYPEARNKKPEDYPDSAKAVYDARMRRLEDSTKDVTLTYGLNGAISYQKAKESELNLGLDLQG